MVKAILDGRKTMTRRVIKYDFETVYNAACQNGIMDKVCEYGELPESAAEWYVKNIAKPKYQVGDVLWVRETTYLYGKWQRNGFTETGKQKYKFVWDKTYPVIYAANGKPDDICTGKDEVGYFKRSSIFMPREVARIFLGVTNVRVERLQDISVQDAKDEGIKVHANGCIDGLAYGCYNGDDCVNNICQQPIKYFHDLWDSLNAKRGYGWGTNPWVWVIEFERTEKP
jgi:hypothetical protein